MRVGWLAFCVWRAAAHQGITVPLKFDDFLQNDPLIEASHPTRISDAFAMH